jgi:hypothetical protein
MPLGNIAQLLSPNKSLFTKNSYKEAIGDQDNGYNGHSVIKLLPNSPRFGFSKEDPAVVGVINNNINFSIDANWNEAGPLSDLIPNVPILKQIGYGVEGFVDSFQKRNNRVGIANIGNAVSSKLFYSNSGRLEIKPEMMIVDWKGTGSPLKAAFLLSLYSVPNTLYKVSDKLQQFIKWLEDIGSKGIQYLKDNNLDGPVEMVKNISEFLTTQYQEAKDKVVEVQYAESYGKREFEFGKELADDFSTLKSSPSPVSVWMGRFFYHSDMVIRRVDFDFSREQTQNGPLYVKIVLDLVSRTNIRDINDVGISMKSNSRVFELNSDNNNFIVD